MAKKNVGSGFDDFLEGEGILEEATAAAVKRTAPLALHLYTLTILWFAEHGSFNLAAYRKAHPWYRQKETPSFADILTCLRAASLDESISDAPGNKPASKKTLLFLLEPLERAA